jgi:2-polyprenyl-3-methyl-5-hydroxy-6-metoxy-1,4-benzoquinol methylase/predicted  nucleic acid-binding Zn-ribbon protein
MRAPIVKKKAKSKKGKSVVLRRAKAAATTRACWCGAGTTLLPFGPEYGECTTCGTLVFLENALPEESLVRDDETDFYGKSYWLERQQDAFGYPDIYTRARNDLPERNLHWLRTLLKYQLPPAEVVDVGCAHGSFVALMQQAGFRASGVELSPWVVAFGQETFGIPVHAGPIETLDVPAGSLDAIALMDVLEHLPDPSATMRSCLDLLKPGGLLLVQTPCFRPEVGYAAMVECKDRFLEMLIPGEHLYLFSKESVTELFRRLGAEHITFEPAIFAHYDMFLSVSRAPLETRTEEEIAPALLATPSGRIALALLDLRESKQGVEQQLHSMAAWVEGARGEMTQLGERQAAAQEHVRILTGELEEAKAAIAPLREYQASADEQIHTLTGWVKEARAEIAPLREYQASADEQIHTLTALAKEAQADASKLRGDLAVAEERIRALAAQLEEALAESAQLREYQSGARQQIEALAGQLEQARAEAAAVSAALAAEGQAHAGEISRFNGLHESALRQIDVLNEWVRNAQAANTALQAELDEQQKEQAGHSRRRTRPGWRT